MLSVMWISGSVVWLSGGDKNQHTQRVNCFIITYHDSCMCHYVYWTFSKKEQNKNYRIKCYSLESTWNISHPDSPVCGYEPDSHIFPVGILQHQTKRLQWSLCELLSLIVHSVMLLTFTALHSFSLKFHAIMWLKFKAVHLWRWYRHTGFSVIKVLCSTPLTPLASTLVYKNLAVPIVIQLSHVYTFTTRKFSILSSL